jgi:hypothetical protein
MHELFRHACELALLDADWLAGGGTTPADQWSVDGLQYNFDTNALAYVREYVLTYLAVFLVECLFGCKGRRPAEQKSIAAAYGVNEDRNKDFLWGLLRESTASEYETSHRSMCMTPDGVKPMHFIQHEDSLVGENSLLCAVSFRGNGVLRLESHL